MAFNYLKLRGRIREKGYTQRDVANAIGKTTGTLSDKLNNKATFTMKEVDDICKLLDIPNEEIGNYFFAE
jgi:transcriptional regulator with XRE-family HTH domain